MTIIAESNEKNNKKSNVFDFCRLPNSSIFESIMTVLGYNTDLKKWQSQWKPKARILEGNIEQAVKTESKFDEIEITFQPDKLTDSIRTAQMVLALIFNQIMQACYSVDNERLYCGRLVIPLKDLINSKCYSSTESARTGLKSALKILETIQVNGKVRQSKRTIEVPLPQYLFRDWKIENSTCIITLNSELNWAFILCYYAIIPSFAFKISRKSNCRGFDLLCYIAFLARQNYSQIAATGSFRISIKKLQERLNLPKLEETNKPADIIKAIERTIQAINKAKQGTTQEDYLNIQLIQEEGFVARDYIERGFYKVSISGNYAENIKRLDEVAGRKKAALKGKKSKKTPKD